MRWPIYSFNHWYWYILRTTSKKYPEHTCSKVNETVAIAMFHDNVIPMFMILIQSNIYSLFQY